MVSMANSCSSSVSRNGVSPPTPTPPGPMDPSVEDSRTIYADQSSSSSTASLTPVDPKTSTSSQDISRDAEQLLSYLLSLRIKERCSLNLYSVSLVDLAEASLIRPPLLENHNALFLEALNFADTANTFIPVTCYFCNNFNTSSTDANTIHLLEKHMGSPPPNLLAMFPEQASDKWIRGYNNLNWIPLDVTNHRPVTSSDKIKRTELLARIKPIFEFLAGHGIFTYYHIEALIELAVTTIPDIPSRQWLVDATLKQSNFCIRVLEAPHLQTALRFVEALKISGLNMNYVDYAFKETQDEKKYQLFLNPFGVSINLKKYGSRPHDLVRWLYDSSDDVSPSSWNDVVQSREHKIRQVLRMYLRVSVHMGRTCQMKLRRWHHLNALKNFRYLGIKDLQERLLKADGFEKTATSELLEVARNLQDSNNQNSNIQGVIDKKINQLHLQCLLCDARILLATRYTSELWSKIGVASKLDYRIVVAPLMKSYIKKRLYDLMEQNVRNHSEHEGEVHNFKPIDQQPDSESIVGCRMYRSHKRHR